MSRYQTRAGEVIEFEPEIFPAEEPDIPPSEYARRGTAWYDCLIRPDHEQSDAGRMAAIDIDSGDFQIEDDALAATLRLLKRRPGAPLWVQRIGGPISMAVEGQDFEEIE